MKKRGAFVFLVFLATAGIYAQAVDIDTGIRRSVEYFEQQLQRDISIAVLSINSDSWTLSEYIIGELSSHFVNDRYFTVVDRRNLDLVQQEINFQLSGEVSDETAQAIGQRIGAETVILGSILPVGNEYRLDLRALSVATGVIQGLHRQDIRTDERLSALLRGGHVTPVSGAWYHNRFYMGLRLGGGYGPANVPILRSDDSASNLHAVISFTGQITDLFGIQAELMWSAFSGSYGLNENRFLIPLLVRFKFRPEHFPFSVLGGTYLSFPMGTVYDDTIQAWLYPTSPAIGVMLGGNLGYHIGPGILFFDIRGHYDIKLAEYDARRNHLSIATSWRGWGGFNFSIGYELGLFGRR
jgi:hypothetical protein